MPCDYSKYPKDWFTRIRPDILLRANNCCERCGVSNYAVGERDSEGVFHPTAGNIHHDRAGMGYLSYKEARELVKHCNECCDDNLIIIVLTIAHLDHDTGNNEYENLRALCQRCHNQHDAEYRKNNRRKKVKNQTELDLWTLGA